MDYHSNPNWAKEGFFQNYFSVGMDANVALGVSWSSWNEENWTLKTPKYGKDFTWKENRCRRFMEKTCMFCNRWSLKKMILIQFNKDN